MLENIGQASSQRESQIFHLLKEEHIMDKFLMVIIRLSIRINYKFPHNSK